MLKFKPVPDDLGGVRLGIRTAVLTPQPPGYKFFVMAIPRSRVIPLFACLLACLFAGACKDSSQSAKGTGTRRSTTIMAKFTMPIDDAFAMKPGGVVVAGVVSEGVVLPGDQLEVRTSDKCLPVTVKGLETFDYEKKQAVQLKEASKGQRVGIWIIGVEKSQIAKGDMLGSPIGPEQKETETRAAAGAFKLVKGCEAGSLEGIHESYSVDAAKGYSVFTINVPAENIPTVFLRLVEETKEPVFFLIEVGTHRDEEATLRKTDADPLHKDVYYLDGLSPEKARDIFARYKDILVDDGGVTFGIGSHGKPPFQDEVFVGPYKILYVYASEPEKYTTALEKLGFQKEAKIKTVWDTFTKDTPGKRNVLTGAKKTIWQMIDELKKEGLYLAERRED